MFNQRARAYFTALVVLFIVAVGLVLISTGRANAAGQRECQLAWTAPGGAVARECRAQGWTITRKWVLDPTNQVRALKLRACEYEDSERCYWVNTRGNGRGDSFIRWHHRTYYCSFGRVTDV